MHLGLLRQLEIALVVSDQIKLLMTIRGITALTAAAFLAGVGDVRRFKSQCKMNGYLGLVPRARDSWGVTHHGHINRESRWLARTMLSLSQSTR